MLRRRRDAALLAPRGRYGPPGPRRPPTLPATHPPSTPGSAPTSPALSAALSPLWPVAPSLPPRLRNPGPSSARLGSPPRPLPGHVGVEPFWGGGKGGDRGRGGRRGGPSREGGPAESGHREQRPGKDGERGRGRDGTPGVASESGWEPREGGRGHYREARGGSAVAGRAPLCGVPGIKLKPEDQPVEDGGMQGKLVATSEAPSFLPKERLVSSTAEGKSLPLHPRYCGVPD